MNLDFSEILSSAVGDLSGFFTALAQSERSKEAGEYSDNPEEAEATEAEIAQTTAKVSCDGNTISLTLSTSGSDWDNIMTSGMGAPTIGGNNGTITLPDGSTEQSRVPEQFWGTGTIQEYSEPASIWKENFMTMAKTLLYDQILDAVEGIKGEILSALKSELSAVLGGAV